MRDKGIREVQTMCYESIELDMYSDREGRKASGRKWLACLCSAWGLPARLSS